MFSVGVRSATRADLGRLEDDSHISLVDGASAILWNGELVAVCNEYGTAFLVAGTDATPSQEDVEQFNEAANEFYGRCLP